jgi:hypothetical protein
MAPSLALSDLESLELRRLRFDLINLFKVFNYLIPFNPSYACFIYTPIALYRVPTRFTCNDPLKNQTLFQKLFYRYIEAWNSLPAVLKSTSSLTSFKRGLKSMDIYAFMPVNFGKVPNPFDFQRLATEDAGKKTDTKLRNYRISRYLYYW